MFVVEGVWPILDGVNVGVEFGQIGVVLLCWPILLAIAKFQPDWMDKTRWTIAIPCIALATFWVGQRTVALIANVV